MITIIACVIFILLLAHLIILPLSKKRPIFIKGLEGSLLLALFTAVIASLLHPIGYLFAIVVGLGFDISNSWFIYGVSSENIENALVRAISASRSTHEQNGNRHTVDNIMQVRIYKIVGGIVLIRYNKSNSKKAKLTKNIFRKFIDNYSIEISL